ncbi:MAG: ATP synthase F1 subunit delta [Lachnospiraceae bacterium]|nr:ATP synthase F1 subunit delta [Lachnospiraceae bacterium]
MTQTAINYAIVLFELKIPKKEIVKAQKIYAGSEPLRKALTNPVISRREKHRVIERIFPECLHSFFKVLSDYNSVGLVDEIFLAFEDVTRKAEGIGLTTLYCVTEPDQKQEKKIREFLEWRYQEKEMEIRIVKKQELIGGFVIRYQDYEIDWSLKGRRDQLKERLTRR